MLQFHGHQERKYPKIYQYVLRILKECKWFWTVQRFSYNDLQIFAVKTYSHYKSSNAVKVMTGVSPAGNITYVSKVYGGRATNSQIFKESDLITLLQPGDDIMVDRGFLIDEVCEVNGNVLDNHF